MNAFLTTAVSTIALVVLAPNVTSQDGGPDGVNENSSRIDDIEDMLFELDNKIGSRPSWLAFSGTDVDLGGHLLTGATHAKGDDSNSSSVSFAFMELYLKARISDSFSVFATPGFFWYTGLDLGDAANPTVTPTEDQTRVIMQRSYGEWHPSDAINVKAGRFGTGHGVITSEYFVPTRTIVTSPLMTRVFGENSLYPQKLDGLQFSGKRSTGSNTLEYSAYMGVDTADTEKWSTGVRIGYIFEEQGLSIAGNVGHGERKGFTESTGFPTAFNPPAFWSPFPILSNSDEPYGFAGVDVDYKKGPWRVKSEFYSTDEYGGQQDRQGWYVQPQYFLNDKWTVAARVDDFQAGQDLGAASETVVSVNYNPQSNVRVRLDYTMVDLPAAATADTVDFLILSASFSF